MRTFSDGWYFDGKVDVYKRQVQDSLHTVTELYMQQIQISPHSRILQAESTQQVAESSMPGI